MVYNLIVSPRAQKEIEKAIDTYIPNYSDIPNNFVIQLQSVYSTLKTNPFFRNSLQKRAFFKTQKIPLFAVFCN